MVAPTPDLEPWSDDLRTFAGETMDLDLAYAEDPLRVDGWRLRAVELSRRVLKQDG